ncbi:ParB/Srx family N-terminal domain-containing protein [Sphingobium sp. AN558]|uniref:ParB/RepB/Spo0J family partition protein n=1 Tax=Sphingobium sp. AN558 TaxID=3133442 RepID=UPI0030BBD016
MTKPTIDYVLARDCFKSSDNVRTHSDAAADAELKANIAANGYLLENLIGVRVTRGAAKGRVEIYGGGRRLEATLANIEDGALDQDFMVPVLIAKNARDAIEMSLAENYFQLPMNPADECCAFQAIIEREKKSPADLARRFGKSETFVLGRLRLANLAPSIFAALRAGELGMEVAKAYGSTADQDRQARIFEQLGSSYQKNNVNEIRRLLASGSYRGADPKALLVGREAYVAAGGRLDVDLFSSAATEIWLDGGLVEELAEQALASAAEAIRDREGFAQIRVVPSTMIPWAQTYALDEIEPEPLDLPVDVLARQIAIEAELEEIEREAEGEEDYTPEQAGRIETLEAERDALVPTERAFTPAQKAGAIAFLLIDETGAPKLHTSVYALEEERPEADDEAIGVDEDGEVNVDLDGDDRGDEADEGEEPRSYSMRLRDELAMMKTELLAVHIASDPLFALDLGTFIMADDACHLGWSGMPSELRAKAATPRVHGFASESAAAQAWAKLDEALDRGWVDLPTIEARYDAFCALGDEARAAWLGWAIARTIMAVPEGQSGSGFLDHLGKALAIDVAAWWRPTARNFFDRLTRPGILDLFQEIGGLELKNRYAGTRKFDLAHAAEKLFAGDVIAEADVKARALAWLPDPMRLPVEEAAASAEAPAHSDGEKLAAVPPATSDESLPQAA